MVDQCGVQRPAQRPVHHIVALRIVLAAHILDDPNVTAFDDDLSGVVIAAQDRAEVGAARVGGEIGGVVGCAGQQDRRVFGSFGDEDDGVQLYAVAHGDHHLAPQVIEAIGDGIQFGGRFVGQGGGSGWRRSLGGDEFGEQEDAQHGRERQQSTNLIDQPHRNSSVVRKMALDYILGLPPRTTCRD